LLHHASIRKMRERERESENEVLGSCFVVLATMRPPSSRVVLLLWFMTTLKQSSAFSLAAKCAHV